MHKKKEVTPATQAGRDFMKSHFGEVETQSDQMKKLPQPPLANPARGGQTIPLTRDFSGVITQRDVEAVIAGRISHRFYATDAVTQAQLAFLLWASQGVRGIRGNNYAALRTVPSGGARHAFETYLAINNVQGLPAGIYHYLPLTHELECIQPGGICSVPGKENAPLPEMVSHCVCDQKWAAGAAVTFFYTMVAYRGEWRYAERTHRVALIDVGHVAQNLYLACEASGLGTCAIAAFRQADSDALLQVDGEEEFTIYVCPVGVKDPTKNTAGNDKLYADVQK
ncbi:SagB/ThcOx family dehydrogenase [Ruminococcaceae bacterium OttesenSCG-928-N02]|nr:SagB/ThcOx family dehydrogenase [Ruminococcaceae bacterium OttesenSCG-928-N02]